MTIRVSVCIPCFNHAQYLPSCLESILSQTFRNFEILITDDGSTDKSLEIARRFESQYPDRIRVFTHPGNANRGVGATANLMLRQMRGELWAGICSDDLLPPRSLELRVAALDRHPEAAMVHGIARFVDARGVPTGQYHGGPAPPGNPVFNLLLGHWLMPVTQMIRKSCIDQVGPQNESLVFSDWEWNIRILSRFKAVFLPRVLALYRVHGRNTSVGRPPEVVRGYVTEVLESVRRESSRIGGLLATPACLAVLHLQLARLHFQGGQLDKAGFYLDEALRIERANFTTPGFMARWKRFPGSAPRQIETETAFLQWLASRLPEGRRSPVRRLIRDVKGILRTRLPGETSSPTLAFLGKCLRWLRWTCADPFWTFRGPYLSNWFYRAIDRAFLLAGAGRGGSPNQIPDAPEAQPR